MSSPSPVISVRQAAHVINPLFIERWSPRAYTGEEIPDAVLFAAFEAARWAPSGSNVQPWRFIYSKAGSESWGAFLDLLVPANRRWAEKASALVVLISKTVRIGADGVASPSRSHSFDTGAAWQNFALQAHHSGWGTRAIGGYDREKARALLNVPAEFALEAAIAIGRAGDRSLLPAELQARETPNERLPLAELVFNGGFRA